MKEMYLYPSGSDELQPERMMNYELSWKHRLQDCGVSYGINLFYLKADNLIQTVKQRNINTGEVENKGVEVEATWRLNRHLTLNTNHSYLDMKEHIVAAPVYKGYLGANYRCGKWSATAGVQQISGLYTDIVNSEHQENFTLLNATLGYQLLPQLGLWVKGENLLAQAYEVNAGYPMPRATFMGGVNIRF
jgi:iron complex outermembrane receptor protein